MPPVTHVNCSSLSSYACYLFLLSCQLVSACPRCRGPQAIQRFLVLGLAVMAVCSISFGPFILAGQLPQVQHPCQLSAGCHSIILMLMISHFGHLVTEAGASAVICSCSGVWSADVINTGQHKKRNRRRENLQIRL